MSEDATVQSRWSDQAGIPEAVYHIRARCGKCSSAETVTIPIGRSVSDHLQYKGCRRCGYVKLYQVSRDW